MGAYHYKFCLECLLSIRLSKNRKINLLKCRNYSLSLSANPVTVHPAKNIVLKGTGVAADPYSAFDNANEHIATRLRRQKTKLNDHKGKTGIVEMAHAAVFPVKETEDEMSIDESAPLTIAETDANIKLCTVGEAVMYMDLADENALMFRNSANNRISMVYRRKDGNIGWVEPAE